ncbi:DUF87 domain-containing protein [Fibrisoma montanum]|uniref:DUF87 domain-containing protein n=1 Tax=Fibrisoma montanum TaxID=2305895 RepID=A0A418LYY8_9BACT|nr:DUF87 domain-containing protein [Fibrisoma montanum]RIV18479.1 DUF87 domain-containing protein [Fibrisoma montanum]
MSKFELFPPQQIIGVFRGFSHGGLEFHADLVLPYRNDFQSIPMHGQFLLVQLETPEEAVLGRITSLSSAGKLSSGVGEEFNIRAMREGRPVPEDLREDYLKYEIDIRVLGVLRNDTSNSLTFVASHRRLPHVGSAVAFPSKEVIQEIAGHNIEGAELGFYALGEYIYSGTSNKLSSEKWMQIKDPEILVKFPVSNLISRRSFIFARAGFGKSNLNKLLFSELYKTTPTTEKRGGRKVPVGTLLFDPDGEYFWPDDKGRPGLCDVEAIENNLVIFTNRRGPSPFYQSFVAGGIKLDIRRLKPSDVISISLSPDRQDQQNVRKLRSLRDDQWEELVNIIDRDGNQTQTSDIARILGLTLPNQEAEALAAKSNMTSIVRMLHDSSSQLMDLLLSALKDGKLCVIDVSQMRGGQSLILSSLILRKIFSHNQEQYTEAQPQTIPTLAVVEEAQSVLSGHEAGSEPYIAWVKEGRKYDLGAVLITQQPGSIPNELLSQGDNWFIFHLLSASDLNNIKQSNAHFSQDILSSLLNEPIPGQGVFWSSSGGKPYPVALRVLSFEALHKLRDPKYDQAPISIYAQELKQKFEQQLLDPDTGLAVNGIDPLSAYKTRAVDAIRSDAEIMEKLNNGGIAWGALQAVIKENLPAVIDETERNDLAYKFVPLVMNEIFGAQNSVWERVKNENGKSHLRLKQQK